MKLYIVVDTYDNKFKSSFENEEQADYYASSQTVLTNHGHLVAEIKGGFKTVSKRIEIEQINKELI